MYEHVREIIDELNENVNTLNECLIESRSEYDDLKYVIAGLVKDVRDGIEVIEKVEKWSKEQKHKISQLEYDILKIYSDDYFYYFYESELLKLLLKKGYFKGANEKMNVTYYLRNCEVVADDD